MHIHTCIYTYAYTHMHIHLGLLLSGLAHEGGHAAEHGAQFGGRQLRGLAQCDREREFENMKILGACLAIQALARGYMSRKKTRKKFQMIAPLAMKPELSDT